MSLTQSNINLYDFLKLTGSHNKHWKSNPKDIKKEIQGFQNDLTHLPCSSGLTCNQKNRNN